MSGARLVGGGRTLAIRKLASMVKSLSSSSAVARRATPAHFGRGPGRSRFFAVSTTGAGHGQGGSGRSNAPWIGLAIVGVAGGGVAFVMRKYGITLRDVFPAHREAPEIADEFKIPMPPVGDNTCVCALLRSRTVADPESRPLACDEALPV